MTHEEKWADIEKRLSALEKGISNQEERLVNMQMLVELQNKSNEIILNTFKNLTR